MTSETHTAAENSLSSAERAGIWNRYWNRGVPWSCADLGLDNPQSDASVFWRNLLSPLNESDHILELGAGNGSFLSVIGRECGAEEHPSYTGVDLSDNGDTWRRWATPGTEHRIRLLGGVNAEELPLDDHSVSLLISQFCFEYTDTTKVLQDIRRVLYSSGAAVGMIIHADTSRVTSVARNDLSHVRMLLADDGLFRATAAMLPYAAQATSPEAKAALKDDPEAEAVRAHFNACQQAVAAAIEASDAPQTLMDASRAAHIVLVTPSQQGLAQAEDQLQGVTGMYQDELQRLDELVACAWSEEQLKVFCTTLEASGFSDITTASISNRDYLMGWSLTARR